MAQRSGTGPSVRRLKLLTTGATAVSLAMTGVMSVGCSGSSTPGKGSSDSTTADRPADAGPAGKDASVPPDPNTSAWASQVPVAAVPAGPVSLAGWRLTLPVDGAGNLSGKAKQLGTAAVTPPWLVSNPDGSMSFWAPAAGATTSHSEHARTELVANSDFTLGQSGVHTLSALLSVTQVPTSARDICVGQIHGGGSINSIPFVMLHWRDGNIVVIVKQVLHGSASQALTLLAAVPLGAKFSYAITDDGNGTLSFTAAYGDLARQATVAIASVFLGTDQRFQVGDYQQAVGASAPDDGGRATFYAITAS